MFCKNCGKEIDDRAVICPHCGLAVEENNPIYRRPTCTLAIVGFVLSFFVVIAGLVCSIIARKKCREENLEGGGFALAGIIISIIGLVLTVIVIIACIILVAAAIRFNFHM